jgi:hypothetical protein
MREHPSGRPIHHPRLRRLSIPRPPHDEPLTPGLRRPIRSEAIGFIHKFGHDEDDT